MNAAAGTDGYDAFISYSHAADGQLSPAVRRGLQSISKPWYRRRALRVFCDKSSLSATPELWPTIEEALSKSKYFVLLASPQAAGSPWVDQEIGWWRANRSASTVLVALSEGELAWDHRRHCFDRFRTTALPPAALTWFSREPLWVDLRWARDERYLNLNDPRFRDCMASLAAPVHGVPKDSLIGEDIREHRRALRLARGGAGLLALFLVGAIVAATIAVGQRTPLSPARSRRRRAAVSDVAQRLDRSMLLAVEGYREENTPQAQTALFQAVTASPQLVRFADNGTRTTALAAATNAAQVVTGGEDGSVRMWDVAGVAQPQVIARFEQQVTAVGVSPDAGVVAIGGAGGLIATVDRGSATPVVP